jgi:hypothetical protein
MRGLLDSEWTYNWQRKISESLHCHVKRELPIRETRLESSNRSDSLWR